MNENRSDVRQMKWDQRFLSLAKNVSEWSKDESTKVGCVIVSERAILSTGYNGLPRGCNDTDPLRGLRPEKYLWFEHAERNAIYNAAKTGVSLRGSTAYVTLCPCMDCARGLVQSGVTRVVASKEVPVHFRKSTNWLEHFERVPVLFNECGVEFALH